MQSYQNHGFQYDCQTKSFDHLVNHNLNRFFHQWFSQVWIFSAMRSIKSDLLRASVVIYDLVIYYYSKSFDNNLFKYKTVAQYVEYYATVYSNCIKVQFRYMKLYFVNLLLHLCFDQVTNSLRTIVLRS